MAKKPQKAMKPLTNVMRKLRFLHKKGEIHTLTEQPRIINADSEYTYVSFKIPKNQRKKTSKNDVKQKEIFDKENVIREVLK